MRGCSPGLRASARSTSRAPSPPPSTAPPAATAPARSADACSAVSILDEADRLTDAAANALLKVLEEPPAQVVFVLVARSAEALLATIPSRARMLGFATLPPGTVTAALDLADQVVAARRAQQAEELAELEDAFGPGRGTGAMRRRLETRHRRELRRLRFDAIRDAVADLLAAYRDMALLRGGGPPERLVHADRAATFGRLAAGLEPAAAIRAAGALEEADRRLSIGAAP